MAVLSDDLLRRQLQAAEHLAFKQIVSAVSAATCNLFLGSAVHAAPPETSKYYAKVNRDVLPPIGNELARTLASGSEYDKRYEDDDLTNLMRIAQFYESLLGRPALLETLKREVETGKQPSPIVRALARLPFPVIITTNYDTLLQKALGLAGKVPMLSVYEANDQGGEPQKVLDSNKQMTSEQPFLFKMHGDIQNPRSIVLTEEDYIQFILRFRDIDPYHSIPRKVLEAVKSAPTLFIGYSLKDYNLRVWLKMLRKIVDDTNYPDNFSVDFKPDPVIFDVWYSQRRYINFIAGDVWDFVPKLYEAITGTEMPE